LLLVAFLSVNAPNCNLSLVLASVVQGDSVNCNSGYTKFSCFLCLWNSRADGEHYEKIHWPPRQELTPGRYDVIKESLVSREKVLLPPLHKKIDLVKQFVKALDLKGETF